MSIHHAAAQQVRQEQPRRTATVGRWITIRAKEGPDGKKQGGSPVFIQDGRIVKGHPSLAGRKIDALKEEPVEISGRRQRYWHRGYERARWGKRERAAGIDPRDLHQLA